MRNRQQDQGTVFPAKGSGHTGLRRELRARGQEAHGETGREVNRMSPSEQAGLGREGTGASGVSLRALEGPWKGSARWDRSDLCFFDRPHCDRKSGGDKRDSGHPEWSHFTQQSEEDATW